MKLDEFLARCLAARKMRLIEDPHGILLPFDLWRRLLPEAEFIIGALQAFDLQQEVLNFYCDSEDGE
jgi:hypothetical protein